MGQLRVILSFLALPGQGFSSKVSRCPVILDAKAFSYQLSAFSFMNHNEWLYYYSKSITIGQI